MAAGELTYERNLIHLVVETMFSQPWEHVRLRQLAAGGTERDLLAFGNRLLTKDLPRLASGDVSGIKIPLQLPLRPPTFREAPRSGE